MFIFPQLNRGSPVHVEGWGSTYWGTFSYLCYDCPIHSSAIWAILEFISRHSNVLFQYSKQWLVIIFLKDEYLYTVKKNFILDTLGASNVCIGYKKGEGPQNLGWKRQEGRWPFIPSEIEFRSFSTSIHSRNVIVTSYKQIEVIVTMWYGCLDLKILIHKNTRIWISSFHDMIPSGGSFRFISGAILCFVPFYGRMFLCGTKWTFSHWNTRRE